MHVEIGEARGDQAQQHLLCDILRGLVVAQKLASPAHDPNVESLCDFSREFGAPRHAAFSGKPRARSRCEPVRGKGSDCVAGPGLPTTQIRVGEHSPARAISLPFGRARGSIWSPRVRVPFGELAPLLANLVKRDKH